MTLLKLAARNLVRHPRRSGLAISALALGVAAVLLLRGIIGGIQTLNVSMFVEGAIGALQVHRAGYTEAAELMPLQLDFEDTEELRARVRAVNGVRELAPRIYFGAALAPLGDQEAAYFMATAVDPVLEAKVAPRRVSWASRWMSPLGAQLLLDAQFARALEVEIPSPSDPQAQPALLAPDREEALNGEVVSIHGTVGNGMPGDIRQGLVDLATAQRLLRSEGRVAEYAIAVHQLEAIPAIQQQLQHTLGAGFEVHTWWERMPALRDVEDAQNAFGLILGGIVLAVVLLGVGNLQLMSVIDRVREVGTMLAVGMRRRQVVRLFVLEGFFLGVMGVSLGAALGLGTLAAIEWHGLELAAPGSALAQAVHPRLGPGWLGLTLATGVLGATLSSAWAAGRLARMSAAEALREP